ncbi:MAG: sigma-70 family RNA polymerase sigma factor [Gammaproteobacteria bacterium]
MSHSVKASDERAGRTPRERFLDALYRQYASPLLRFISRQNIGTEEAREIVQESYCRLHQVPQVEALESPRGYLYRTAINLARDSKRQRRREFHVVDAGDASVPAVADVASEAPTAYQVLKGEQELAIIRQAIAELSPTCRQVFVMHRFGSAKYSQIAERLGLSVSMIEKHVSQALAHLKTRLDEANSGLPSRKAGQ